MQPLNIKKFERTIDEPAGTIQVPKQQDTGKRFRYSPHYVGQISAEELLHKMAVRVVEAMENDKRLGIIHHPQGPYGEVLRIAKRKQEDNPMLSDGRALYEAAYEFNSMIFEHETVPMMEDKGKRAGIVVGT